MMKIDFNCAEFATAIKAIAKFTDYKQSRKKTTAEGYVLISFRKSGLIDMTFDAQQGGLTAGYEFVSFRATGFDDKDVYAVPVQMMLEACKRIRKNTRGFVTIQVAEDHTVSIQVAEESSKAHHITGTCGDPNKILKSSNHQHVKNMLTKSSKKVEIIQAGLLASLMGIGISGIEAEKKTKLSHEYTNQLLFDIGMDHSYIVGTNVKKMAVAELAIEEQSIVHTEAPVKLLIPARVTNSMVDLFKQEATSQVNISYTKQEVLIDVEANTHGTGRYFICINRIPTDHYPEWRDAVPADVYKDRTVAELEGGSLLLSLSSIANVAVHNMNNKCTLAIQKNQVSVFTQRDEDSQKMTGQAVPAVVTGEPVEVSLNFTYLKESVLPLTNRFGKVSLSIGSKNDSIVVFSERGKVVIASIKTGEGNLHQTPSRKSGAGITIDVIKAHAGTPAPK